MGGTRAVLVNRSPSYVGLTRGAAERASQSLSEKLRAKLKADMFYPEICEQGETCYHPFQGPAHSDISRHVLCRPWHRSQGGCLSVAVHHVDDLMGLITSQRPLQGRVLAVIRGREPVADKYRTLT